MTYHLHLTEKISIHALREEGDCSLVQTGEQGVRFLSTPSARRATDSSVTVTHSNIISIHALREEGDVELLAAVRQPETISIHALREEGDV